MARSMLAAIAFAVLLVLVAAAQFGTRAQEPTVPAYTADGRLVFPTDYRKWVFLTSGVDMSYTPNAPPPPASVFDNVFVNREAYDAFQQTGTWPDKTVLMLEVRGSEQNASINTRGHVQTGVRALEVHVKDSARFAGGWGFFSFNDAMPAQVIPREANCYSCHEAHAAVDTTFVQFYPTLLPLARTKNTLSPAFLAAEAARPAAQ